MAVEYYYPRYLRITDDQGLTRKVDEAELLSITGPKIVLGEPGMGKSELIKELGRRLNVQPVTAVHFMHSKNPAKFVVAGQTLLIDGLDEAMARRDGDAVDVILSQLEVAGSPDFIMSCRAREWQSRSVTNLRQIYGAEPVILLLEALSRSEASAYLTLHYAKADPEHVLSHLEEHRIADLYSNPLTLGLMGQVAEYDAKLPSTRAALFDRVCKLIWLEHDPDRQDSGLGNLTEDQALSAAGAIMAGFLFAGAEAVSLAGPAQLQDGDVRLIDLESLPGAGAARAIYSSKLFQSVDIGRAKPIHRVIAEFLGAHWLAGQAMTPRTRRRLLTQFHGSGAVPASLRGLHAWLAFHSPMMAKEVISADPFGVLRYGDTASFTAEQADCMFDALQALAIVDPYFRAQDWDSHTAIGLMTPNLSTKIKMTITSAANSHLRSLLIEGLKGTLLAGSLADTLEVVMLSTERFYSERQNAVAALMPYRDRVWWKQAIANLHDQGTEDSTQLARSIIEEISCDVTDELLVAVLLAEMGITICPLPLTKKQQAHTIRYYGRFIESLPATRLIDMLNILVEHVSLLDSTNWQCTRDFDEIVSALIVRGIDEKAILPKDSALLWYWLGALQRTDLIGGGNKEALKERLNAHDNLRRAVQLHALYVNRPRSSIWMSEIDLRRRMVGLSGRTKDVIWFLERLAGTDNRNLALREDWRDLMRLSHSHDGFGSDLLAASRKFQDGDEQLEAFVLKLESPKKPAWKLKEERSAAKQDKKRRIANERDRRQYIANKAALRAGEPPTILDPARAYLGLFHDLTREQSPTDRIVEWLGVELAADAMAGFEAILHRSDIPSPKEVARSFAKGQTWSYHYYSYFAIMAGLLARQRAGLGFDDLSADVRMTGLLLCYVHYSMCRDDDLPVLCSSLEQWVIPTAKAKDDFARLWIEPSLVAGTSDVSGIYKLAHDDQWQSTGAVLASEWLKTFPNLPEHIELELVDCLTHAGALVLLASVADAHSARVFHDVDHMFAWLAIDVLVRFDTVLPNLSGIGSEHPEFIWFLRNRFQLEGRGAMLSISTAQAKWIVSEFRTQWPYAVLDGSGSGNTNPYDATNFLRTLINLIADDTSKEASMVMQELISEPVDSYSDLIRHMAAEQRQKRAEEEFESLPAKKLGELLSDGPPSNADDLKSLVLEELAVAQKILIGDDLDQVRDFWSDTGVPYDENRCRDRLAAMIGPELMRYGIQRITEADMPNTKRVDLAFAHGQLQLPMEVKGQWHSEVWQAATDQLNSKYLIDWRSEQRGIYCVLWFGDLLATSGRRLQAPPKGLKAPKSADEMCRMLIELIPEAQRTLIDVVVIDLTAGKPKEHTGPTRSPFPISESPGQRKV